MKWTSVKPTAPGWWWYRSDGEISILRVVFYEEIIDGDFYFKPGLYTTDDEQMNEEHVDDLSGEWGDQPIAPPEEA